jgi:dihydrodipicolinate synthase/N-acetylneuraminate lyase
VTTPFIVVPVLTAVHDNTIRRDLLDPYAARAAASWVDAYLLSGSTTRGDLLTTGQRADLIDLWLRHLPPQRLIACCWHLEDITEATARGVAAMMVMRNLSDRHAALEFLATLPVGTYIYSHPMYTPAVFDVALAADAAAAGVLPAGGKIAKTGLEDVAKVHAVTGPDFALWDGSSRHMAASVRAGAAGIIATPLCPLPSPFPSADLHVLQPAIDTMQAALDALPGRAERTAMLTRMAFTTAHGSL